MSLDLQSPVLRMFLTVLETGSFTAAADALGFTQSAVSKQIQSLERAVGAPLFVRNARGVELTRAGLLLATRATAVLEEVNALERDLAGMDDRLSGRVTLGGFPTTAIRLVPAVIARLRSEHPGIGVQFQESSTPVQIRKLRGGRIDLAVIAVGEGLPDYELSGITVEPLAAGPLRVALPTTHRLARHAVVDVSDLAHEEWIVGHGAPGDPQFGAWPSLPEPTISARVSGWAMRLGFVAAGLGLTTLPNLALAAIPQGVTTIGVEDPGWQGRQLLLAWIGELDPAVDAVRRTLRSEADRLAAPPED